MHWPELVVIGVTSLVIFAGVTMYWLDGDVYGSGGYNPMPVHLQNGLADAEGNCLQCGQPENHPVCCLTNAKPGDIVPVSGDPSGILGGWSGPMHTYKYGPETDKHYAAKKPEKKKIEPLKTYTGRKFREG